jgi:hypothetical protein
MAAKKNVQRYSYNGKKNQRQQPGKAPGRFLPFKKENEQYEDKIECIK